MSPFARAYFTAQKEETHRTLTYQLAELLDTVRECEERAWLDARLRYAR